MKSLNARAWWRVSRGLALVALVLALPATAAHAVPRGKVSPRVAALDAAQARLAGTANVGRPGATCRPTKHVLKYHGGALVQHPNVFVLFWGSAWNHDAAHISAKNDLVQEYQKLVDSEYACAWQEYSVPAYPLGTGTYAGSYVIASNPPQPVQDAQIQMKIQQEIGLSHAPARTEDTVYVVVLPDGFPVEASDGSTGCGGSNFQFCGYHDAFDEGGFSYRYEVLPFPCNAGHYTCFVGATDDVNKAFEVVASHELTELVTDPDNSVSGWYADRDGAENADICSADACTYDVTVGGDTFLTNSTWSNLGGGCVDTVPCPERPIGCIDPAPGACAAGRDKTTGCELEWQVDPNLTQTNGITTSKVFCNDGLPFCDGDGAADGTCTFHVAACMNSTDPRLASCSVQPIQSVVIKRPLASSPVVSRLVNALATADTGTTGSVAVSRVDFSTPAATPNSCTTYLDIPVAKGAKLTINAVVSTAAGHATSKLRLSCK